MVGLFPEMYEATMLLTLTTTHQPATDLGFLLHKHPGRVHSADVRVWRAGPGERAG